MSPATDTGPPEATQRPRPSQRPRAPITAADLARACYRVRVQRTLRNGGTQMLLQCLEHPRFTITHWAGRPGEPGCLCHWVDGRPVPSLAAAAAALNRAPTETSMRPAWDGKKRNGRNVYQFDLEELLATSPPTAPVADADTVAEPPSAAAERSAAPADTAPTQRRPTARKASSAGRRA